MLLKIMARAGLLSMLLPATALANADAVFKPVNTKLESVAKALSGGFAVTILTLIITVFGLLTLSGRVNKVWGISICGGAFIVGAAGQIAKFMVS